MIDMNSLNSMTRAVMARTDLQKEPGLSSLTQAVLKFRPELVPRQAQLSPVVETAVSGEHSPLIKQQAHHAIGVEAEDVAPAGRAMAEGIRAFSRGIAPGVRALKERLEQRDVATPAHTADPRTATPNGRDAPSPPPSDPAWGRADKPHRFV
ncbi:hypothetical protein Mmc1_1015 [Magnetococcus marinus MC-1]|uniref:Uncharacterized protein n=1 Tax=Magnetococcus marinus (strain ATCC BAA-1437 / JCM 17883 / MC-1) TaxID=156889 RepID=A0L6E0_MAGMM|nr:hypothetical protein [Magnetococcus marinus]ABK43533.1 hypothetical protein Mmc1_1015 [Magnetococcus marinus MC-1]